MRVVQPASSRGVKLPSQSLIGRRSVQILPSLQQNECRPRRPGVIRPGAEQPKQPVRGEIFRRSETAELAGAQPRPFQARVTNMEANMRVDFALKRSAAVVGWGVAILGPRRFLPHAPQLTRPSTTLFPSSRATRRSFASTQTTLTSTAFLCPEARSSSRSSQKSLPSGARSPSPLPTSPVGALFMSLSRTRRQRRLQRCSG